MNALRAEFRPPRHPLGWMAAGAFLFYVVWNIWWLLKGSLPPSIFLKFTGLPCPTTGFTRSWLALCRGEFFNSLLWNPFALPIAILCIGSLGVLFARFCLRRNILLPRWMVLGWAFSLTSAWIAKFVIGPKYW